MQWPSPPLTDILPPIPLIMTALSIITAPFQGVTLVFMMKHCWITKHTSQIIQHIKNGETHGEKKPSLNGLKKETIPKPQKPFWNLYQSFQTQHCPQII